jgi:isoleucyl-tRNA synthetase
MKPIVAAIASMDKEHIAQLEAEEKTTLVVEGQELEIALNDVEILTQDIPGWLISTIGQLTVALDITITDELKAEGLARELINRIQNIRKEKQFEVTDKIQITLEKFGSLESAVEQNYEYICSETLADSLTFSEKIDAADKQTIELTEDFVTNILVEKQF